MGIDSISSGSQPGGIIDPNPTVPTSPPQTTTQGTQDTSSSALLLQATLLGVDPSFPSLAGPTGPSLLEVLQSIGNASQNHKESVMKGETVSNLISAQIMASQASGLLGLIQQKQDMIDEANTWIDNQKKAVKDVSDAHAEFSSAVNSYNSAIGGISDAQLNAVNGSINLWNYVQTRTPEEYLAYITARGVAAGAPEGQEAAVGQNVLYYELSNGFNSWNNYVASLGPSLSNFQIAASEWTTTLNEANASLNQINDQRRNPKFDLDPISTYPPASTTYTAPGAISTLPGVPYPPGPGYGQIAAISRPSGASLVPLSSLSLSKAPDLVEIATTPGWIALSLQIELGQVVATILDQEFTEKIGNIVAPSNFGTKQFLPAAFVEKLNPNFILTGSGGSGVVGSGNAQSALNRAVPAGLLNTTLDTASIQSANRLVATLQLAALGVLTINSIAAAVPAASSFASSLGNISLQSPAFAAILASETADKTQSAVASNQSRITANILLKNVVGAASAAGVTFGDIGAPSAGQMAEIAGSLSAAFNATLLGLSLATYEQSLGFPNLSLQVLANTEGLSPADVASASVGGSRYGDTLADPLSMVFLKQSLLDSLVLQGGFTSEAAAIIVNNAVNNAANGGNINSAEALVAALQGQFMQQGLSSNAAALLASEGLDFINAQIGVGALNQVAPNGLPPGITAENILDAILVASRKILATLEAHSQLVIDVIKKIAEDREKVAAIIKETILADIRAGKADINLELRNPAVAALKKAGFSSAEALYIANQAINGATGNPVTPLSGGVGIDQALLGLSDVKLMNKEELRQSLSKHLDGIFTGLGAAKAATMRENILKGILDEQNPTSIVSQIKDQIETLKKNATDQAKDEINRNFLEDLRRFTRPSAELGYAITSMQEHAAVPLSLAASFSAQGLTDILSGSRG